MYLSKCCNDVTHWFQPVTLRLFVFALASPECTSRRRTSSRCVSSSPTSSPPTPASTNAAARSRARPTRSPSNSTSSVSASSSLLSSLLSSSSSPLPPPPRGDARQTLGLESAHAHDIVHVVFSSCVCVYIRTRRTCMSLFMASG